MDQTNAAASAPSASCRSFTLARRVRFLSELAGHGHVRKACAQVGVSPQAAYMARRRDASFAAGWDAAMVLGLEQAEQVLAAHATEGYREQIWYRGEVVGERIRFDARLQLAWLARLDARAANPAAHQLAGRFDDYLAALLDGDLDPEKPFPTREEAMDQAASAVNEDFPGHVEDLDEAVVQRILSDPAHDPEALEERDIVDIAFEEATHAAREEASALWHEDRADRLARLDAVLEAPDEGPDAINEVAVIPAKAGIALLQAPRPLSPEPAEPQETGPKPAFPPLEFKSHEHCQLRQLGRPSHPSRGLAGAAPYRPSPATKRDRRPRLLTNI